jgi:hypothetical protein
MRLYPVTLICTLGLAACEDSTSPVRYNGPETTGRIQVALQTEPGRWHADQLVIDSARIVADTLIVHATHGGGCARHGYAAVAWNGWLESFPVQVGVVLAHDANNDPCDALLQPTLRFDLTPLREAYDVAYRRGAGSGPAELIIRLSEAHAWNRAPVLISYHF